MPQLVPKHSPLPWSRAHYAGTAGINDAEGHSVADAVDDADAELILRAVDNHERLVAALRGLLTCSLPRDVSGQRIVDDARDALASATT